MFREDMPIPIQSKDVRDQNGLAVFYMFPTVYIYIINDDFGHYGSNTWMITRGWLSQNWSQLLEISVVGETPPKAANHWYDKHKVRSAMSYPLEMKLTAVTNAFWLLSVDVGI